MTEREEALKCLLTWEKSELAKPTRNVFLTNHIKLLQQGYDSLTLTLSQLHLQ